MSSLELSFLLAMGLKFGSIIVMFEQKKLLVQGAQIILSTVVC